MLIVCANLWWSLLWSVCFRQSILKRSSVSNWLGPSKMSFCIEATIPWANFSQASCYETTTGFNDNPHEATCSRVVIFQLPSSSLSLSLSCRCSLTLYLIQIVIHVKSKAKTIVWKFSSKKEGSGWLYGDYDFADEQKHAHTFFVTVTDSDIFIVVSLTIRIVTGLCVQLRPDENE